MTWHCYAAFFQLTKRNYSRCPEVGQQALNLAHSLYLIGQHSLNEAAFCRMRPN